MSEVFRFGEDGRMYVHGVEVVFASSSEGRDTEVKLNRRLTYARLNGLYAELIAARARIEKLETEHREFVDRLTKALVEIAVMRGEIAVMRGDRP